MQIVRNKSRGSGIARKIAMGLAVAVVASACWIAFGPYAPVADAAKPPKAPVVTISRPVNGASFAPGVEIFFYGTATDTEDGDLSGELLWTSDIDGDLHTGATFASNALSDGVHTIEASATGSSGATGTASVTITVEDPPEPPVLGPWSIETIEPNGSIGPTALAYGPDGYPSVAYSHFDIVVEGPDVSFVQTIKFAHYDGEGWVTDVVVDPAPGGVVPSLAYDPSDGEPSVSYTAGDSLMFAHFNGVTWDIEPVDVEDASSLDTTCLVYDVVYDENGEPLISYPSICYTAKVYRERRKLSGGGLKFARKNGTAWVIELVDAGGPVKFKSLAYDTDGNPAIAYGRDGLAVLAFVRHNGTSWGVPEIVRTGDEVDGLYPCLAFNPDTGYPEIVHNSSAGGKNNEIVCWGEFVAWNGSTWEVESFDPSNDPTAGVGQLIYDASGIAMVAFSGGSEKQKLAWRNGPADWSTEVVEEEFRAYDRASLALDPNGNPAILYSIWRDDLGESHLRFAVRDAPVPDPE